MKFARLVLSVAMIFLCVGLSVANAAEGKILFGLLWGLLAAGESSRATVMLAELRAGQS